jgi:hypothetical protein
VELWKLRAHLVIYEGFGRASTVSLVFFSFEKKGVIIEPAQKGCRFFYASFAVL